MTEALYKILTELKLSNRLKVIEILQKQDGGMSQNTEDFLKAVSEGDKKE